jgi:hypothetical protein
MAFSTDHTTLNQIVADLVHPFILRPVGINAGFGSSPLCRQLRPMEFGMNRFKEDEVMDDNQAKPVGDGIDRRNFLGCMAWAGTGLLWTMAAGVPTSRLLALPELAR